MGQKTGAERIPSTSSKLAIKSSGSRPGRSSLLINVKIGIPRWRQTAKSLMVCGSTPRALSISITALSAATSVRYVSSEKSWWPGVSSRFSTQPPYSNWSTVDVIEMPRCFSSSIQSEVACLRFFLAVTDPAS